MRKVVMQMMTTLNGRLDDPNAWASGVPEDLYAELDRLYGAFDTILVGRVTYEEMVEYWPAAELASNGSETSRSMARKMNAYKKYVITGASAARALEWKNSEAVLSQADGDIVDFLNTLKAQPGGDIHLAGGAMLAQTIVRLGLVDRYHLFVYPVTSPSAPWFERIDDQRELALIGATAYSNGVVGLYYEPSGD